MTRRPRGKRPPRLDLPPPPRVPARREPRVVTVRNRLLGARLAGVVSPFGRAELSSRVAGIVAGNAEATFGLDLDADGGGRPTRAEVWAALAEGWGVAASGPTCTIAVERTIGAAGVAAERLAEVCAGGGTVTLATTRPASMLWCYQELARLLETAGATVLRANAPARAAGSAASRPHRSVWWLGGVAVVTDGRSIRADDGAGLTDDWLFGVGRPDLVVADRGFAAAALACGHPTVAPADLDAVALEVVARRGAPIVTVPVDCSRAPEAYSPLLELLGAQLGAPDLEPGAPPAPLRPRVPHSTTPPPGAYAAPESGGEG